MTHSKTIAVTAATGRLGSATLRALKAETDPKNIIAIARRPERVSVSDVEARAGDYGEKAQMIAAFAGVDTVVMISAPSVVGTDQIALHRTVIEAAKDAGVRKIVCTSVIGNGKEQGTWFSPTLKMNRDTEQMVKSSGMEWMIARNGLYLELDLHHIIAAQHKGVYSNSGGEGLCGYISIDEIAYAMARMACTDEGSGRIYNIIGETTTQANLVALANDAFDLNVKYVPVSDAENVARLMKDDRIAQRGEPIARMLAGCFQAMRQGALDVDSDYKAATGRPCKSFATMMAEIKAKWVVG